MWHAKQARGSTVPVRIKLRENLSGLVDAAAAFWGLASIRSGQSYATATLHYCLHAALHHCCPTIRCLMIRTPDPLSRRYSSECVLLFFFLKRARTTPESLSKARVGIFTLLSSYFVIYLRFGTKNVRIYRLVSSASPTIIFLNRGAWLLIQLQ